MTLIQTNEQECAEEQEKKRETKGEEGR